MICPHAPTLLLNSSGSLFGETTVINHSGPLRVNMYLSLKLCCPLEFSNFPASLPVIRSCVLLNFEFCHTHWIVLLCAFKETSVPSTESYKLKVKNYEELTVVKGGFPLPLLFKICLLRLKAYFIFDLSFISSWFEKTTPKYSYLYVFTTCHSRVVVCWKQLLLSLTAINWPPPPESLLYHCLHS